MEKLLIIDGHNLLFQMFYGMPSRIFGRNNQPVHAIIGFVGALLKIIKNVEPTHILVIYDGEQRNNRSEIDPEYKANRESLQDVDYNDNPFSQLVDIKNVLDYINIKHFETSDGYETDDYIASYVKKHCEKTKIIIVSSDTDFLQLVNHNVTQYMYRGKNSVIYDEQKVIERYGINSNYFADYKALIGDKSDNITGASKVGPKTAMRLINQYGGLNNIFENIFHIESPSIKSSLSENMNKIKDNMKLIKLTGNVVLPFHIDDISYTYDVNELSTMRILKEIGLV